MKKQEESDKQGEVERKKQETQIKKKDKVDHSKFVKTEKTATGFFEGISKFFNDLLNL